VDPEAAVTIFPSMNEPPVSIVIPAYNHAQYVDEAIRSVLAQDYPHVEVIVLDDGSRDGTREVLRRYENRFYWETHENMGQAATLTKGWSIAHGEILGYLSADDRLEPSAVSESVAVLKTRPEAAATYCDFNLIDPHSRVIRRLRAPDFSYARMLATVTCPPGPGALFRRAAYERAGPWDATLRQMPDYDFWLRLGLEGPLVRIPKVLAGFRVHQASQTYGRVSPERAAEPVLIVARLFRRMSLPPELAELRDESVANAELVSAQLHLRAGRFADAWRSVRRAASLWPAAVWSSRSARLLLNAALNRLGHRVLWSAKMLRPRSRS
jgi:glycosyltransferase involved in cell wall biosynthesis